MRQSIETILHTVVKSLVDSKENKKAIISKPAAPVERHCYRQSVAKFRNECGNYEYVRAFTH